MYSQNVGEEDKPFNFSGSAAITNKDLLSGAETDTGDGWARGGAMQNWAPIALADGKLLIRDQSRLLCVKVVE